MSIDAQNSQGVAATTLSNHPAAGCGRALAPLAQRFRERVAAQFKPPFRGTIWENCAMAPMGKGHGNEGKPFDIETACYLKPVLLGIQRETTRKCVIKAGVKTMKTFCVEMAAGYYTPYGSGDVTLYFGTGDLADDQATTRFLDWIWGITAMAEKRATIVRRFDDTTNAVKFPDKTLRIWSANLGSTQGVNLEFVGVCDAFLTAATGMIDQAIARTTQYAATKKIVLESQGGEEGFDFDRHYDDTDQGELHVVCPCCERPQIFNWRAWHRRRPDDFQAKLPKARIEEIEKRGLSESKSAEQIADELENARKELTTLLKSEARRDSGFKRGDDSLVKRDDGSLNEREVLRGTYFECFDCGSAWKDDGQFGATRVGLDVSSHYVTSNPNALTCNVGFNFPQWISRRLRWGEIMLDYLKAKKIADSTGNLTPIKIWWQKVAARTWSLEAFQKKSLEIAIGSYEINPALLMPNFHSRNMGVDSQKKLDAAANEDVVGSFWYVIRDFDKFGNSRQVARGFAESWEALLAVQKFWKVPNQRLVIDSSKWGPQIEMMAAMNFELVTPRIPHPETGRKDPYASCWRLYYGDKRAEFRIEGLDGKKLPSSVSDGQPSRIYHSERDGRKYSFRIFKYRWSNLAFELQLDAILSKTPGMPRFETLPREGLRLPDGRPDLVTLGKEAALVNNLAVLSYDMQMGARYLTKVRGAQKFEDIANREAHYRDCELECLVRASQDGLLGHVAQLAAATTTEMAEKVSG